MNESKNRQRPADITESGLRDLYRELAVESPPADVDDRILAEARAALGDRAATPRNWMRPLAVAATLGLCVALVLEIGTGPGGTPAAPEPSADKREEIGQAARESRAQKMGENKAAKSLPETSSFSDAAAAPAGTPARIDTNAADAFAYDARERDADDDTPATAPVAANGPAAAAPRQAAPSEPASLEEVAGIATASDARETAEAESRGCGTHDTVDARRWLDCIDELEAAGEPELAASERRRRRAAFPDAE